MDATVGPVGAPAVASEVMNKISTTCLPPATELQGLSVDYHRHFQPGRKIKIKYNEPLTTEDGSSTLVQFSRNFGVKQLNNLNHRIATGVERYCANMKSGADATEDLFNLMQLGFGKFVNVDELRPPVHEELALCRSQALMRIAAKSRQKEHKIYGETDETYSLISCFNKQQLKSKVGENQWLPMKMTAGEQHIKGGQMVSAQPKEVNQIVAPWTNWVERVVFANLKPGVIPGYGYSARTLKDKIANEGRRWKGVPRDVLSCDLSEQDTSKGYATNLFTKWLYRLCGVPEHIINMAEKPNKNWIMNAKGVKIPVQDQFQSGRASTLVDNTFDNMAKVGLSLEFDELHVAVFQGDDAYIQATSITTTQGLYHRLKIDKNEIGEFIGMLIYDFKTYIDIPRVAGKVLSKPIEDNARFNELKVAVADLLRLNTNLSQKRMNIEIAAHKYGVPKGDMEVLYSYLQEFSTMDDLERLNRSSGRSFGCEKPKPPKWRERGYVLNKQANFAMSRMLTYHFARRDDFYGESSTKHI